MFDGGRRPPLQQGMIIRARTVVTMDGQPIDDGAVVVTSDRIAEVGEFSELKAGATGELIDLGEQVLLPGLINAHCHLDYTCLRGKIPPQPSFVDWIRVINAEKAKLSENDYIASIKNGFAEAERFGTTTIANLTAFPELISQIDPPIRTWWFPELIDVRAPERANEIVDLAVESVGRARPQLARRGEGAPPWGLAPHALFTASKNLYRRCEDVARCDNILLTTHLAESRQEMEMFREAYGPLYGFVKSIGRPMDDCGKNTPLELFLGAIDGRALPDWLVGHLNELTASDFDLLKSLEEPFHVVHCPRSHDYFNHVRFALEKLRALGFNVCLGTDSLASNKDLSLFAEMRMFQKEFPNVRPEEILQTVTINPARALRQANVLGRIRPGFRGDLIAVPSGSSNFLEETIAFEGSVNWMLLDGKEKRNVRGTAKIAG